MDPGKRRGYPLRRWRGIDAQPRVRRRVVTRQEPEPEPDVPEARYRDAGGVWQGGRDGYGWQRYGD
jgi:hypothetical protein